MFWEQEHCELSLCLQEDSDTKIPGSPLDSQEMLVVTLGNLGLEGNQLSLEVVKLSLLNEEARRKDKHSISDHKSLVTKGDSYRGRGR